MGRRFKIGIMFLGIMILCINLVFAAVCSKCGYNNKERSKFCVKCGNPLTAEGVLKREKMARAVSSRLAGPKKTIAVIGFNNASGISGWANLGSDFTTQLTDALIQSGKFTVLSRTELGKVFKEQDLVQSGRLAKSLTAQRGKALPAQILITGKITEFEQRSGGGAQGLNIKGIRLGMKKTSAHIAVIIQIIDSTTGEVLDSKRMEGRADASGFSMGYSGSWSMGSSSFKKTPLGKATQIAIDRAVVYIADKLSRFPWKGKVVTVKQGIVYLNAGSNAGITKGMKFAIYRKGESLVDPETGIELGAEKTRIAEISVIEVQPKFSKANILNSTSEIKRTDLVLRQ